MIVAWTKRLLEKLKNKKYRDAYIEENVRTGIAFQIRAMREQRENMSQIALGEIMGKPQSVVSRLEDPDYGKVTLQTLFEVASAFDVALIVQFVNHADFLTRTKDVTSSALQVDSFNKDQLAQNLEESTQSYIHMAYHDSITDIGENKIWGNNTISDQQNPVQLPMPRMIQ